MEKGILLRDRGISEVIGRRSPTLSIVASASLAVICLFYAFSVGAFLQVRVYPLVDRVTLYMPFNFHIINQYLDQVAIGSLLIVWLIAFAKGSKIRKGYFVGIVGFAALYAAAAVTSYSPAMLAVALASLPTIIGLSIYARLRTHVSLKNESLTPNYLAIVGTIIGGISFAIALIGIASNNTSGYPIAGNYGYDLFLLFSSLAPMMLLVLITCFPVKFLIDIASAGIGKVRRLDIPNETLAQKKKVLLLSLIVGLSVVIAIIPHFGTTNPGNHQVGVDTGYYVNWVKALRDSQGPQDFVYQAFVQQRIGDRPVTLIFIYGLEQLTGANNVQSLEQSLPLILGPALVLAVYFLSRELFSNDTISLCSAFVTAVSFQILVGIYAGFYANWLALIIGYVSFAFLFRFLKKGGTHNLALFSGLLALTLFAHVYTWSILTIVSAIFLLAMIKLRYYNRKNAALLLIALLATVAVDFARATVSGSSGGIEQDMSIGEKLAGPDQFALRWNNLTYTTTTFVGGLLANCIMLGLGLFWLVRTNAKDPVSIFLMIFLIVGILPFLFGEWVIQTRVFYNIPFQIPAAAGLFWISKQVHGKMRALPIYVWLVMIAVIAVSNFTMLAPPNAPNS